MMQLPSDADHTGRDLGAEELTQLQAVIESGTLNCTKGTAVKAFERRFAELMGVGFCRCTTSGTASIHAAIAAIDPEPGDEIITTTITDMGGITPILYQTAIPVFADVDPHTYNVTAETIAPRITERTRAIIVTHLFGNPCDMQPIMDLAAAHDLPVIEDSAQALLATYRGSRIGTIGDIGCFSLQQGKHMTTGEGGMVITNRQDYWRRTDLFVDKAWGYGDPNPDHYFLALNYRMTELQGAVALAQLEKLERHIDHRVRMADRLAEHLRDLPGVSPPRVTPEGRHVYWRYALRIDSSMFGGGVDAFGATLKEKGIFCAPRYVKKPAFECQVLADRVTFGKSKFPFEGPHRAGLPPVEYDPGTFPGTYDALAHVLVLPLNEKYTEEHVDYVAEQVRGTANELGGVT